MMSLPLKSSQTQTAGRRVVGVERRSKGWRVIARYVFSDEFFLFNGPPGHIRMIQGVMFDESDGMSRDVASLSSREDHHMACRRRRPSRSQLRLLLRLLPFPVDPRLTDLADQVVPIRDEHPHDPSKGVQRRMTLGQWTDAPDILDLGIAHFCQVEQCPQAGTLRAATTVQR